MDQSRFIRGLLDDPADPQQPQYVPANDFGPRAYGLLNTLFPDPYEAVGDAVRQYRGGDAVGAFETMFGAIPATGALSAARGRFGGAVMSPVDELFHGSPVQGLTTLTASERGPLGPGVYTSPSRQISGHYAGDGGHVYQVPHEGLDIYRGDGHRTDDQWFGYKNDQRRLIEAVPDEHKSAVVPVIEKMWSGDGYPLYQRIRGILGGDEQAQALFKKAGFHGISGQIDGPETLIFGNVPLKAANLPMDEASRLARAAEQGFTIDAYKGSPAFSGGPVRNWRGETIEDAPFEMISEFNSPEKPYAGFFSDSPSVASRFADVFDSGRGANEWGASVFPTKLKMQNPLVIDGNNKPAAAFQFESIAREHGTQDNLEAFKKAFAPDSKHDGLIVKNTLDEGTVYIPRTPNQIRSRFAAFDPSKADSKNIMAAFIGLLGGGAAMDAALSNHQGAPGL